MYLWNDCLKSALNFMSSSVIDPNCFRVISASAGAIGLLLNRREWERKINKDLVVYENYLAQYDSEMKSDTTHL